MKLTATIANALWSASNLPAYLRFRRALPEPQVAQELKLRTYLARNANTAFGKAHHFAAIRSYDDFARRVPLADYDCLAPWIARIRCGESNVLTHEPVTHLIPTSGSTGARKLIPFTAGLQKEFNAAIGPWILDLQKQSPGIIAGPAYWSVTPCLQNAISEESVVPIGFDTDTAYLGGARRRLAEAVMAVPPDVQRAESIEAFRYQTLFHLLRCHDLRLISVWHPSFLTLLLDSLPENWDNLLSDIANGRPGRCHPLPKRSQELKAVGPQNTASLWRKLRVVSCWGDGHAEIAVAELQSRFPTASIQRKGLLATEGVISIPFSKQQVLAVQSHFFEFLDSEGNFRLAHQLRKGEEYEVVITTGGGLWRYRLKDRVRITGFAEKTPSLQFLGKTGDVSDRRGEKLSETFVTNVFREAMNDQPLPRFALLAPDEDQSGCGYTLFVEGEISPEIADRFDSLLQKNPQYAWCRKLGQLRTLRLFHIRAGAFGAFTTRECANGKRLGDVKPRLLSTSDGWSRCFDGEYVKT